MSALVRMFEIPSIPPSTNHAYIRTGRGKRVMHPEARKWVEETRNDLLRRYPSAFTPDFFEPNTPYALSIIFWMPDLYTKGWPKKAQSRYKTFDVTNHVKLLEDILVQLTGVDDACHLCVELEKCASTRLCTTITFRRMTIEETLQGM